MSLQEHRKKIDQIDTKILQLLNQRATLSEEVGKIKKTTGKAVFAPEREELLLGRLEKRNNGPMSNRSLRSVYREILSASRSKQRQLRIAFLGPEATYCHQAATHRFGAGDIYVPCKTIPDIFSTLASEDADAAVVPIENSNEGGVNATHDALVHCNLFICGEIYLPIRHAMVAARKNVKVNKIYSHPQAFGQCRNWLIRHYPNAELVEVSSTSYAAQKVKTEKNAASISSPFSAEYYKLSILHSNIQDSPKNQTRFLMLSRDMPAPSKKDKTSLLFAVSHEVGALSKVLRLFSDYKLNLEKIESRPTNYKEWEYLFFVDVKGHCQQSNLAKALKVIQRKTLWLKILGSYPEAKSLL